MWEGNREVVFNSLENTHRRFRGIECMVAFLHSTQTLDTLKVVLKETALLDEGGQSLSNGLSELIPGGESGIMADYFVQSVTVML